MFCSLIYVTSVPARFVIVRNFSLQAKEQRFIPEHGFLQNATGQRNRKKWFNLLAHNYLITTYRDSGEKLYNFGGDSVGHCEEKTSYEHVSNSEWLQRKGCWISRPSRISFLFVGLDEERSLQNKCGCTRRVAPSHFGCCCPHKEPWRSTRTPPDLHTRAAKCFEVDGEIVSFMCDKVVI
jgi:hypothetical protein